MFIFMHYPCESQPDRMIMKIYMLYQEALEHEQSKMREKEAYSRPGGGRNNRQQNQNEEEYEVI